MREVTSTLSPGCKAIVSRIVWPAGRTSLWVWMMPLGRPVVPDE